MAVPVAVVFIAVFIAGVRGNTCESDASLSSVEILSDLVDARINAIFAAKVAESTAAVEQRFNATVDERISTVSATLSALNATLDERITTISTTVDAQNVTISELLSQPGKLYSAT